MLLGIAMQKDWQPDRRVSLGLAAVSAALLGVSFTALLHGPRPETNRAIMSLSLASLPKSAAHPHRRVPQPPVPTTAVPQPLKPDVALPLPDLQQSLLDAARETAASMRPGVFLEAPAERGSDLTRALRAPEKPGVMQEGQSYRSLYGDTVMKAPGGGCASMQELQASPSPTNKVMVGFSVPCPGEYHPTIGDALTAWAGEVVKKKPAPP
jgi:hypothetical protein